MFELFLISLTNSGGNVSAYLLIGVTGILSIFWNIFKLNGRPIKKKYLINKSFFVLLAFCFFYSIHFRTIKDITYYFCFPLIAYLAGIFFCIINKNRGIDIVHRVTVLSVSGFGIHAFMNYVVNQGSSRNSLIDFYSGSLRSATCSGAINTLIFSLSVYFFLIEKNKKDKMIGSICWIVSLLYAFRLGTRTQFVILVISILTILIIRYLEKGRILNLLKALIGCLFLIIMIYLIYKNNIFNIATFINNSNLVMRYNNQFGTSYSDMTRRQRFIEGIINIFLYPWGKQDQLFYHNLWLDVSRIAGIIPFFLMVVYTIIIGKRVIKIFFNGKNNTECRYIILSVFVGFILNFFVEPAIEGMFDIVLWFFMFNGIVEYVYSTYS